MPAAVTRTRTSPGPGTGEATRSTPRARGARRTAALIPPRSPGPLAAVDEHRLAGHEVGGGGGQVDHERPQLLGAPGAPRGNLAQQPLARLLVGEGVLVHRGHEPAGRDRVHLDVVASP